ncbi:hypothetical protein ABPG72_009739 [Tetrahymena utriculariae]
MSSLLKKKNYNTTKGTKRWRKNLDASDLHEKIIQENKKEFDENQAKEKIEKNEKITFSIDTTGDKKMKIVLEKNRFHKKIDESNNSKNEEKKLKILAKKLQENQIKPKKDDDKIQEERNNQEEEEVNDAWDEEAEQQRKKPLIQKKQKIAHLIVPTSGMSYNPSFKEHQETIEEAIRLEDEDLKDRNIQKIQKLRKKKKDLKVYLQVQKLKREQTMNPVQRQKKEERRLAHQANLIKQFKKEINQEEQDQEAQLENLKKKKEAENQIKEKLGYNFKPEKLGKKRYNQKGQDFVLEEDLPDNLRTVQPAGSLLRDEYESVFRKGLLEPKNYFQKDKKSKIPAIKYKQKFDPTFQSEWDEIETALDIKQ